MNLNLYRLPLLARSNEVDKNPNDKLIGEGRWHHFKLCCIEKNQEEEVNVDDDIEISRYADDEEEVSRWADE